MDGAEAAVKSDGTPRDDLLEFQIRAVIGESACPATLPTVPALAMVMALTGTSGEGMISGAIIAEIATLVGDPARATMVSALLDGRALTAGELALAARVTPQTASTHLGKLTRAGLLSVARDGRNRHFRLASPKVAAMIEGIVAVALEKRPRFRPLSPRAHAVGAARMCYDHLAGRLAVDLTDALVARAYLVLDDETAEITTAGARFLSELGIALPARGSNRRHPCRLCLDWTERRPHVAGALGAALTERFLDLGWITTMKRSHAVVVTPSGRRGLKESFGLEAPAPLR
jgi:DNA-binding transcriptional ArsR family regulator